MTKVTPLLPPEYAIEVQSHRKKQLTGGTNPTIGGQSQIVAAAGYAWVNASGHWAVIDIGDLWRIAGCTWTASRHKSRIHLHHRYVDSNGQRKMRIFHRVIVACPADLCVDHKDCNTLNNTRDNLRLCTHEQNCRNTKRRANNTSGFKGVHHRKDRGTFSAQIKVDGRIVRLGCFRTAEEAHAAYAEAASKFYGEFARAA